MSASVASFGERFQAECVEGSAIAPALFEACTEVVEDTGFWEPQQAIGWEVKTQYQIRKPHNFGEIAMFVQEDDSYWQGKPQHRRTDKDGKQPKYEAIKELGNRPYLPPIPADIRQAIAKRYGCDVPATGSFWEWLQQHPEIPILITEGAKKSLALLSLGYVAVALYGVNSGYQKLGPGLYRLLPDLLPYLAQNRRVTIAFDQDTKEKTQRRVAIAMNRFSNLLERNLNPVKVATWERSEITKGADDLIAHRGPDAMHQAIAGAVSWADQRLLQQLERQLTKPATLRVKVQDLSAIDIESIPTHGIVAIASAKGTGKTGMIQRGIAGEGSALVATHRIALTRNICERVGCDYRGDLDRHQGRFINGSGYALRVGTCIDSLLAMNPQDFVGCDLVIDEVVQVMRHILTSSTCNKDGRRPALLARLHQLVQVARRVIIADADLNNAVLDYFAELRGEGTPFLLRNDHQGHGYPCQFIESPDPSPAVAQLIEAVKEGQRLFIATDSKAGSKKLNQLIKQLEQQGLQILLLNSETSSGDFERAFIQRPNDNLTGIDVVIATPSMATGVSIEAHHFDAVYGLFWGYSSTDADMAQALSRVRQPVPRVVWCAQRGSNFSSISRDTNHLALKAALKQRTDATAMMVRSQLRVESANLLESFDWQSDPHLNLWARVEADRNRSMWNLRDGLRVRLESEGNTLERVQVISCVAEIKEAMKAARDVIKQQEAQAIASARDLDPVEAKALEAKEIISPDDQLALSKFALASFYCVAPSAVDVALVDRDNGGRLRSQLRALEEFASFQDALARDVSSIDRQSQWESITPWDFRNAAARQRVRTEALGLGAFLNPGREWTAHDLAPHAKKARDYAPAVQAALNFSVTDKVSDVQIIHQQLEALGLKISFRWSRTVEGFEGIKLRVYRLTQESWQFAQEVLARRLAGSPSSFNELKREGDPMQAVAVSLIEKEVGVIFLDGQGRAASSVKNQGVGITVQTEGSELRLHIEDEVFRQRRPMGA